MWRLIDVAEVRHFCRGDAVFRQGEAGVSVFVIVSGQLEVRKEGGGRSVRLITLDPPDAVGEIGVVDGGPRTAAVYAVTDSVLLELSRDAVFQAWDDYPEGQRSALLAMAAIARRLARWEGAFLLDARARLAQLLLALADAGGHVRQSQLDLAEMLVVHRSHVARHIAEFRRAGYLARTPGRITVINRRGLACECG